MPEPSPPDSFGESFSCDLRGASFARSQHIRTLRDTGCLFVISAVESVDDAVLERLDKGRTRADFLAVVELFREVSLALHLTFVPFTPWTTLGSYW